MSYYGKSHNYFLKQFSVFRNVNKNILLSSNRNRTRLWIIDLFANQILRENIQSKQQCNCKRIYLFPQTTLSCGFTILGKPTKHLQKKSSTQLENFFFQSLFQLTSEFAPRNNLCISGFVTRVGSGTQCQSVYILHQE